MMTPPRTLTPVLLCALSFVATATEPINVRTVPFDSVAQVQTMSAPATVVARDAPALATEIEARITELPVSVGDRVESGALIARLDCRRFESIAKAAEAELARTRAQQSFARAQLIRARDLQRKKSISKEILDQRRSELAVAQADIGIREEQLRRARIDVGHCELRAPFDAVVTARKASVGSYAMRGMIVAELIALGSQDVSAALRVGTDHDEAARLQEAVVITFDTNGSRYPVRLRALLPNLDPTTRTREARLVFVAEPAPAGAAGRIIWQTGQRLLPADLLVRREGALGVFILDSDRARFVALSDAQEGRPARAGLDPDARLISDGRQRLRDGDPVRQVDTTE